MVKKEEKKEIKMNGKQIAQNYEMHKNRLQQINQRINSIITAQKELDTALKGIQQLKNKENTVKVMIGAGVYTEAVIEKPKTLTVTLPNGILIEKTTEETIKEIQERITETKKILEETKKIQNQEAQQFQFFQNLLIQGQQFMQKQREQKK
jgi:prefoldin alpha subunit